VARFAFVVTGRNAVSSFLLFDKHVRFRTAV